MPHFYPSVALAKAGAVAAAEGITMTFHIVTIFPDIFNSYFNESILKRALDEKLIQIKIHNLRDWTTDKHKTVDDTPYGGGAGMIMKADVLHRAIQNIRKKIQVTSNKQQKISNIPALPAGRQYPISKTILTSAKGKKWNQALAKKYSGLKNIILICGRYEGVDERVTKFIDEEISIGDYVLTGGEIPAMVIIDSITRLIPGVLGNEKSLEEESFSFNKKIRNPKSEIRNPILEYPQYTRPEIFTANNKKYRVPKVLLSGNHEKIKEWRDKHCQNK